MIEVTKLSLSYFIDRLANNQYFSYVRYGNGEWGCILNLMIRTPTDSQKLDLPDLRIGLLSGILAHQQDDSYLLAIQSREYLARIGLLVQVEHLLSQNASRAKWHCGEVFTKASMRGELYPLIEQLRKMRIIMVGPHYLKKLNEKAFRCARCVVVPSRDCFTCHSDILSNILKARAELRSPVVISFSAGPTAKVLIHWLHDKIGKNTFLIDFGSLWDPYVGRKTRRYHVRVKGAILKRNLTGRSP